MILAARGRYRAREARDGADLRRCQGLRHLAFREARGLPALPGRRDADAFDARCRHVMVEDLGDGADGRLVACFRHGLLAGEAVLRGYTARSYDLRPLASHPAPMIEMGRFCVDPGRRDPAILCTALAALLRLARAQGAGLIFGCASFEGARPETHAAALAALAARHLAPPDWRPRRRAAETVALAAMAPAARCPAEPAAERRLPPLLRAYLSMGGRVSDHAVIDRELDTLHVFIAVDLARLPTPWRRRLHDPAAAPAEPRRAA